MGNRKIIYPILILLTLLLGEFYRIFATDYVNEKQWFLIIDLKQDLEWYIKDSMEGLTWIIFLSIWYLREKKRDRFWASFIKMFLLFRIIDISVYWLNHRHAGGIYLMCYLSIIIYGGTLFRKYYNN